MSLSVTVAGTEYADAIQPSSVQATQMANDGEAGFGGFAIDDPGADILTVGHKAVVIEEDACAQPRLFTGWTTQRDMGRSGERGMIVADDRLHDVTLVDLNACLRFRILRGADTKRPEETMDERLAWLIGKPALTKYVTDFSGVDTGYDSVMDEADYRGLYASDVLDDVLNRVLVDLCYFVYWNPTASEVGLYFGSQSGATTESSLSISNVLADVDGSTVFAPDSEATLARKPDQVYSGVLLRYREGERRIFRERPSTETNYVERGATIDRPRTKKLATAQAQAERWLTRHSQEVDTIFCTIIVPPESAGLAIAGQRIDVKFSHLPSYTDWTSMRIVQSTISPLNDVGNRYTIALELENPALGGHDPDPESCGGIYEDTATGYYPPNNSADTLAGGINYYYKAGTVPPVVPTPGWSSQWHFPSYGSAGSPDSSFGTLSNSWRIVVVGTGTLTIKTAALAGGAPNVVVVERYEDVGMDATLVGQGPVGTDLDVELSGVGYDGTTCVHAIDMWAADADYDTGGPISPNFVAKIAVAGADWAIEEDTTEDLAETPTSPVESTSDPTVDDDSDDGYVPGQIWVNTSTGDVFILVDSTTGAAVWTQVSGGGGCETVNTVAASGAAETIDLADGTVHDVTLDADCTFTFAGATAGQGCSFTLVLRQDGTGGWTSTWPASVDWPGGVAPTLDETASSATVLTFFTLDGGTNWFGFATGGGGGTAGTPALTLGTSNATGAASTFVATDASIAIFDATAPTTLDYDEVAAAGSAAVAARRDHVHGMPAASTSGGIGALLISDSPSTPLVFADLLQNEDQDDLLYADP